VKPRALGLVAAAGALLADQAHKFWMLDVYDIAARQPVHVTPFLDLVMAWNPGISYSLLPADTAAGRWGLLALALGATLVLGVWMWRTRLMATALGLGLIVGGALGNAWDRYAYGAVADFFLFHIDTARWGRLNWYVFNLADVAIVAGVVLLLYDSLFAGQARAAAATPE
jgi:signal peptidase II